ncbi:Proline iminopeptidase [Porphyridium purpureum]|uniref:Proline iminopeptidase n=1 Tax=Porphyridium purpureum TaxID=35688 RepID=A0A5J4Z632_PORPP|nr:Proline iminopeptidase [Porphyridium purpureum]|eukprot:POR6613..scf295_1
MIGRSVSPQNEAIGCGLLAPAFQSFAPAFQSFAPVVKEHLGSSQTCANRRGVCPFRSGPTGTAVTQGTVSRRSFVCCANGIDSARSHEAKHDATVVLTRRQAVSAIAAAAAFVSSVPVEPAAAFCGDEDPFWAHFVDWKEELIPVALSGSKAQCNILVRSLGNQKKERAAKVLPVIFIADLALPHEYLEPLEALAESQRRLYFFDQLGTGSSDAVPENIGLDAVQLRVAQVAAILEHYKLPRVHVFGHGFGGAVALAIAEQQPQRVASLILESPVFSYSPAQLTDVRRLLQASAAQTALPLCAAEALQGAAAQDALQQSIRYVSASLAPSSSPQNHDLIPTYVLQPPGDTLSKEAVAVLQKSSDRNSIAALNSDEHSPHLYSSSRAQVVELSGSFLAKVEAKDAAA